MSRDTHPGVQCPHCQSHLALVPVPGNPASGNSAVPPIPVLPITPKEEWQPPPVAEVLAVYAGRVKDSATASRGAAKVRESLNRARAAAAQRRAAQKTARRTPKSA
ncbi:hypothetical protein [Actinomadura chibensis]|uniref:Uncharacterized protein n=1 Tax=Actinomadura chibensis TaxID=392828 RepID=A0A5D0NZQ2_9ACTN|nr:hypothetical protein [Actinomadura chibensis]TYB49569.1 hypothetical protein FXF69_10975 [Actinomadura chibensis]